jgi:hypothetical protein
MRTRAARVIVIILTLLIGVALAGELFFFFRPPKDKKDMYEVGSLSISHVLEFERDRSRSINR